MYTERYFMYNNWIWTQGELVLHPARVAVGHGLHRSARYHPLLLWLGLLLFPTTHGERHRSGEGLGG